MNKFLGIFIDEEEGKEIIIANIPFVPKAGDVFIIESLKNESISLVINNINYVILNKNDESEENKLEKIHLYCSIKNKGFGK